MNCWLILFQVKTKLGFGIFLPLRLEEGSLMFRDYRYVCQEIRAEKSRPRTQKSVQK